MDKRKAVAFRASVLGLERENHANVCLLLLSRGIGRTCRIPIGIVRGQRIASITDSDDLRGVDICCVLESAFLLRP